MAQRGAVSLIVASAVIAFLGAARPARARDPFFQPQTPIPLDVGDDAGNQSVVTADLNKDGHRDIIAISRGVADGVWILLGHGDGTFDAPKLVETSDTPSAVAVAQLSSPEGNVDGNLDIVVSTDLGVELLLGDGQGNFDTESAQDFSGLFDPNNPIGITVADFDKNGFADIAVLDMGADTAGSSTVYFFCNMDGNFVPCNTASVDAHGGQSNDTQTSDVVASDIRAGDFDGNGAADVVVLNQGDATFSVIYGNGDGSFDTSPAVQNAKGSDLNIPQALAVGDLDHDSSDDIVVASAETFSDIAMLVSLTRGKDRFQTQSYTAPGSATIALTLADVAGGTGDLVEDGNLDAVFATIPEEPAQVGPVISAGDSVGGFADSPFGAAGAEHIGAGRAIVMANVGGDERLDIIQLSDMGDSLTVCLNTSALPTPTITFGPSPTATTTRTGSPQPTSTPRQTSTITPTRPTATQTLTSTPTPIPTADYSACEFSFGSGTLGGMAVGALDRRGGDDVAVTDKTAGVVRILLNTSDVQSALRDCAKGTKFTPTVKTVPLPVGQVPGTILAVDLDGDNLQDLIVVGSDQVMILWNNGDAEFSDPQTLVSFAAPAIVADAPARVGRVPLDIDGDGRADIVVAVPGTATVRVLYGSSDRATSFSRTEDIAIRGAAKLLAAGDFDGSLIDLVGETDNGVLFFLKRTTASPNFSGSFSSIDATALTTGLFESGSQTADVVVGRAVGTQGAVEVYNASGTRPSKVGGYATDKKPAAAAVGWFDAGVDQNTDVVAASSEDDTLRFALGNGKGDLPTVLDAFQVAEHTLPQWLGVGLLDDDQFPDVVTAGSNGNVSVLLSQVPPATPTAVPTGTDTPTGSPTATPTLTPIPSGTVTGTATITTTPGPTRTASPSPTLKMGAFSLSSCAISEDGSGGPYEALAVLALMAILRVSGHRTARRRQPWVPLILVALVAMRASPSAAAPAMTACTVTSSLLGSHTGPVLGAAAADIGGVVGADLALVYTDGATIALVNPIALRDGVCPGVLSSTNVTVQNGNAIALHDLNGDQPIDLIVTSDTGVQTFINSNGTFTTAAANISLVPAGPVAVGKLNGKINDEMFPDVAVGNGPVVDVLLGTAGAMLSPPMTVGTVGTFPVFRVAVADFNHDLRNDIAAVDGAGNFVVYEQQAPVQTPTPGVTATPVFTPQVTKIIVQSTETLNDLQVGNLDGARAPTSDQVPDVAFITDTDLRVMIGSVNAGGHIVFTNPVSVGVSPPFTKAQALAIGDFDDDHEVDDIAVADAGTNEVRIFIGDGLGAFTEANYKLTLGMSGPSPTGLVVGKFDTDTQDDIVTTNSDGSITFFLSSNPPPTSSPTVTPTIETPTPTLTTTRTATATPPFTPTATATSTATTILTVTPTPQATVTHTFGGFDVQGSCAVAYPAGLSDAMPLVVLAALALLRRRARA